MNPIDVRRMMGRNRPKRKPYPKSGGDERFGMPASWFRLDLRYKMQTAIHLHNMQGMKVL